MLTILGPAKTIDTSPHGLTEHYSLPQHVGRAGALVDQLRGYSLRELKELMKVSESLAVMTFETYASWSTTPSEEDGQQALLAFSGEVFRGLEARSLSEEELLFAQVQVRILSGLYGILRPLDRIHPYRLEMGTKMRVGSAASLYTFWKDVIPSGITELCVANAGEGLPVLINLASGEYFRSIAPGSFPHRVITPVFRESTGSGYRNVTVYAKKARGMMLRYIIQNRITDPEYLHGFDEEGYVFNPHQSKADEWVFTR